MVFAIERRVKFASFLIFSFFYPASVILLQNNDLDRFFLGTYQMQPRFADLRLILSAAQCHTSFQNWPFDSNCDYWARPYNYPSAWAVFFRFLGLGPQNASVIGKLLVFIFGFSLALIITPILLKEARRGIRNLILLVVLILYSPATMLTLERGNSDIFIFFLMALAFSFLQKNHLFSGILTLSLSFFLKIYTFLSILIVAKSEFTKKQRLFALLLNVCLLYSLLPELANISERSLTSWNAASYGNLILPNALNEYFFASGLSKFLLLVISLLQLTVIIFLCFVNKTLYRFISQFNNSIGRYPFEIRLLWELTSLIFTGTFLVGTSYDLRLIFLIPVALIYWCICIGVTRQVASLVITSIYLLSFRGSFFTSLFIDILIVLFQAHLIAILLHNRKVIGRYLH